MTAPPATPASRGCLFAFATPFLLFGLIMSGVTYGQLVAGPGFGTLLYGLGALAGLGLGLGIIRGRSVDPGTVSKYPPAVFHYAIGGVFLLIGLALLRAAFTSHPGGGAEEALALGIIAAVVLVIGSWFIIGGGIESRRDAPLAAALLRKDPEPWLYVRRWADGTVRDSGIHLLSRRVIAAGIVNAVTWPIAIGWTLSPEQPLGSAGLVVWLLPLGALVMAAGALRDARRRLRYGGMTFTMDTFPGVVGGRLAGTVRARTDLERTRGANLTATLTSIRRREDMSVGRDNRVRMKQLSQQRQTVSAEIYRQEGVRYIGIPISFDIPFSAAPTTLDDPGNRVLWQLEIESDLPTLPARAAMEVPVFDLRDEAERLQEVPDLALSFPDGAAAAPEPVKRTGAQEISTEGRAGVEHTSPMSTDAAGGTGLRQRLLPGPRFVIDQGDADRISITSERGEKLRSRVGLAVALACLLGLAMIIRTPALQEIGGIGLLPIFGMIGGGWLWASYRLREAQMVLSTGEVTVRGWAVKEGEVTLQYDELDRATVETGVERTAPPPSGTTIRAIRGYDVQLTLKDSRFLLAGLCATDRQQAQWVAGHLNRRIAAAGSAAP